MSATTLEEHQTEDESAVDANIGNDLAAQAEPQDPNALSLAEFIGEFGEDLLHAVGQQNPPIYNWELNPQRQALLDGLKRAPFPAQAHRIHAGASLLVDNGQRAKVLNGEMGTGKTMMGIALSYLLHEEGFQRCLVLSPPHLVYKWRREIQSTVPGAAVWILNGPDTLRKLLQIRQMHEKPKVPTYFIMGRVRMRMGFDWKPAFNSKIVLERDQHDELQAVRVACCPKCGKVIEGCDADGEPKAMTAIEANAFLSKQQRKCQCGESLWSLTRNGKPTKSAEEVMMEAVTQIPTIGEKTARKLLDMFGSQRLGSMLEDNVYEFINLMDAKGDLFFSDRQAKRMERAMATTEFSFGSGGYQPTEFVKRYLPKGFFGCLIADEGHEFKNEGSAQGQAFGVLCSQVKKAILLTGTLMGGYADDLFYLLWRLNPGMMIEDGFLPHKGSLSAASMGFMREHGVLKDIYRESGGGGEARSHRTAKGKVSVSHHVAKGPGFGPMGIMRFVLPITSFLKLKDIGAGVLPPYTEHLVSVHMSPEQETHYKRLALTLKNELAKALRCGDKTLMGVVLNVLLAWPDCAFRSETVLHPRHRSMLAAAPKVFDDTEEAPKEEKLIEICRSAVSRGRKVLVYTTYTGTRDTSARLKVLLEAQGFKVAVLKATVEAARREDWIAEKVDQGFDVIVTNPELVKTGLDMLEFPTIVFMQTGYNVYTLQQAARRSWRIGQQKDVDVWFLGYAGTAQMQCLELMSKKIAVSQSTSGDMPDSGLDVLNDTTESVEIALAKQLLAS